MGYFEREFKPDLQMRTKESETIKNQVDEFLKRGGKINVITVEDRARLFHKWKEGYAKARFNDVSYAQKLKESLKGSGK